MNRWTGRVLAAAVVAALAPWAIAQKINQPWTYPRGAHESRVITCTQPVPAAAWRVALDDWICPQSGKITRVQWWGIVTSQAQLTRRYYIAIRRTQTGACRPDMTSAGLLFQTCVTPSSVYIGLDCQQRRVFRFSAGLPAPYFTQTQGTQYWLQISEDDSSSVQTGVEDFRWSSHLPISPAPMCPAVQVTGGGVFIQPTPDDCPQPLATDLAFRLFGGVTLTGTISHAFLPARSSFMLHIYTPTGTEPIQTIPVEPNSDGAFEVETDLPEGRYRCSMMGEGYMPMDSFFDVFVDIPIMIQLPPACLSPDFDKDSDLGTDFDLEAFFRALAGRCN